MNPKKTSTGFFIFIKVSIVLFCTSLLVAILLPNVMGNDQLESANRTRLIANGRGIFVSVFAQIVDAGEILSEEKNFLPLSVDNEVESELEFTNSNDYFIYLVKNEVLPVNWSYFAAMGVPAAEGKYDPENPESAKVFKAENNAWSVVADLTLDSIGTPFLVTRNLKETKLKENYNHTDVPDFGGAPYDKEAIVVIRMGGSGEVMRTENILWRNLNPGKDNNPILRPGEPSQE